MGALSASYMVAVVEDRHSEASSERLYVWPMSDDGSTFSTRPFIRPLHHFVAGLALCGTQLGLIRMPQHWDQKKKEICCARRCTTIDDYYGYHHHSEAVILQMEDLGSPFSYTGSEVFSAQHSVLHEDDGKLFPQHL